MSDDPTDLKFPHDHIRLQGCYQCVLPEGVTDLAVCAHAAIARLTAENKRLRAALLEAADDIEHWGGYASDGFQQRWDLAGDIKRARSAAALSGEDQK